MDKWYLVAYEDKNKTTYGLTTYKHPEAIIGPMPIGTASKLQHAIVKMVAAIKSMGDDVVGKPVRHPALHRTESR